MTAEMWYQEKNVTTTLPPRYHHFFKVIAADAAEEGMIYKLVNREIRP